MNEQLHADPLETERYVGSRVLLAAGAVALILGATFFFKLAFDNHWIGPTGRVALGLLAGSGVMLWSERVRASLQSLFSDSMTAIGACLLYLSLWAAGNGFHIVPIAVSFGGMAFVTATLLVLALRRNSEITAVLGLAGGFLTPALTNTGAPAWTNLFIYLTLLNGALVFIPRKREWNTLIPCAFIFTQLYFIPGLGAHQGHEVGAPSLATLVGFATAYLAMFSYRPIVKTIAHQTLTVADVLLVIFAAGAYYATLHSTLYASHRLALTAAIVSLSLGYVLLAYLERSTRTLFATLALALCTGGVAVAFDGRAITAVWAIEGALLAWAGSAMRLPVARMFAFIAFVCGLVHLSIAFPQSSTNFFNERFITLIVFGASFAAVRFAGIRYRDRLTEGEGHIFKAAEIFANIFLVFAFSDQLWTSSHGNQLSLTLALVSYGAALLMTGFAAHSQYRRMQALVLLALAVGKAFLVDLNTVEPAIRIISFLALGSVLLGGSYWYFRSRESLEANP